MLAENYNGECFHCNNEDSHNSDKESDNNGDTESPAIRTSKKQVTNTALLATCSLLVSCLAYTFTLNMEVVESSTRLHITTSQKIAPFTVTGVRTSSPK